MTRDARIPRADADPRRVLGFWSASALVVASMLGAGVFTTSGFLLADLGSPLQVLAAWAVGGGVALLGAACYAALAREIPESGGEYLFLARTLHPMAGTMAGWVSLLVGFSAPLAAAAHAFGQYLHPWAPSVPPAVSGSLLLILASVSHAWTVRGGAAVQNAAVAAKLLMLALLLGLGATRLKPDTLAAVEPSGGGFPLGSFAMALVWVSFSYAGWNSAVYVGGEVRHPERTLPRALLAGTTLVMLLYLALNAVFVLGVPRELIAGRLDVGRLAAEHLGGRTWAAVTTALIALALVTSVSSQVMAGPRVYTCMAADGCLPAWLRSTQGPPRNAIVFQAALALLLLWSARYQDLLTFIGFTLGLSNAATVAGLMRLRRQRGPALRVPGWPWVPGLFLFAVAAMTTLSVARAPIPSLAGAAVLGLGALAWRLAHRTPPSSR